MKHRRLFAELLEDRALLATFAVAPSGSDTAGNGSVSSPFRTIQRAVNEAAASGDNILVAGGTYTYDASQETGGTRATGTQNVVTIINKNVGIYGGYSAADGFSAANPQANPTVLDGQNQSRGIFILGFPLPDNSVVQTGATVEGVTVRNGLATGIANRGGADSIFAFGGGVFMDFGSLIGRGNSAPTTFRNVTFENNRAVGLDGVPSNPNLNFGGAGAGGAMSLRYANDVRLDNVVFRNNVSQGGRGNQRGGVALGGAIHTDHSNVTGNTVLFDGNQALAGNGNAGAAGRDAGGLPADATGGAVAVQIDSTGTFTNVTAVNNLAVGGNADGFAGQAYGGAFFAEQAALTLRDGVVQGNTAKGGVGYVGDAGGGGIQTDRSNLTLDRVKVIANQTVGGERPGSADRAGTGTGAGVYSTRINQPASALGTITVTNSVIADNRGTPAASFDENGGIAGQGLWLQGVNATVSHTTIANNGTNRAGFLGEAVLLINNGVLTPTTLDLSYSLVTGHGGLTTVTALAGTVVNLNRNLFQNTPARAQFEGTTTGTGANSGTPGQINGQGTNLRGDPGYASPGAPNFNYSLTSATAQGVNAATGSSSPSDIGNNPRSGTPDLGAYEFGTPGSAPAVTAAVGAAATTGTGPTNAPPPPAPPPNPPTEVLTSFVGYPQFAAGADVGGGTATLYNPDGTARFSLTPFPGFAGGIRTAAADFTGDGVADLVVGTGPGAATRARIFDGATQAEVFAVDAFEAAFTGGIYVIAGDVTGDGVPELVITPDEGGGPRVDIYNGSGFGKITSFFGIDDLNFRGGARAAVSDLSGDGRGDLVVVAGFGGGPRVAAFNGTSLASAAPVKLFGDFFAFEQTLRNGVFVTAGDVNGDGFSDLIAGGGPGGGPRVLAISGRELLVNTVTPLANFFGGDVNGRGGIRLAVKNLDNDTRADLVVGSGSGAGSRVTSYLGANLGLGTPASGLNFDAFAGFTGGVFVG